MSEDNTVRIWDAESGKELHRFGTDENRFCFATFSQDVKKFAVTERDMTVRVIDVDVWKELQKVQLKRPFGGIKSVYSSESKKIVVPGDNGEVEIFDTESGKVQNLMEPLSSFYSSADLPSMVDIKAITFSPDGKKIGIAGSWGFAGIWILEYSLRVAPF